MNREYFDYFLQAVQKGLAARHREGRAAERTLEVREQREPKRNAADEPFSTACYSQRLRRLYDLTSL
jgi:hypothetical protein